MLKGNTKGIINHLKKDHAVIYNEKYATAEDFSDLVTCKQRRLIDMNVNIVSLWFFE